MNLWPWNCVGDREPNTLTICVYVYIRSLCNTMPLQYVATTERKKDQVLKNYVHCMTKLSIKHLFKSCGNYK